MSRTDIVPWACPLALWLHLATVSDSVGLSMLRRHPLGGWAP
jgi:hypothetical protein